VSTSTRRRTVEYRSDGTWLFGGQERPWNLEDLIIFEADLEGCTATDLQAALRRADTGCMDPEYPGKEPLAEIGRVTIAGSRLDLWMGFLWHHLDPTMVDVVRARRARASRQEEEVRRLASERLRGEMHDQVIAAVDAAARARFARARLQRNEVVHQDWVLRFPPTEFVGKPLADVNQLLTSHRVASKVASRREFNRLLTRTFATFAQTGLVRARARLCAYWGLG
jgi:hypothetical protein